MSPKVHPDAILSEPYDELASAVARAVVDRYPRIGILIDTDQDQFNAIFDRIEAVALASVCADCPRVLRPSDRQRVWNRATQACEGVLLLEDDASTAEGDARKSM